MAKIVFFLTITFGLPLCLQAQQSGYFNHTDFGVLFGGTKTYDTFNPRLNFTFESFNGVMVHPKHAVGLSLGFDTYPGVDLAPISFGWRGFHDRGGRTNFFAATNLGYGSAALMKRENSEFEERWHEGGLMYSAAIGIRRKTKKNTHAYTWSLGYKRQNAYYYQSYLSAFFPGLNFPRPNAMLPPGVSSMTEEALTFNSLMLKWGFHF
jgi:hypothetical protein